MSTPISPDAAFELINEHRLALGHKPFERDEIADPINYLLEVGEFAQYGEDFWQMRDPGDEVLVMGGMQCDNFRAVIVEVKEDHYIVRAFGDPADEVGPCDFNFFVLTDG